MVCGMLKFKNLIDAKNFRKKCFLCDKKLQKESLSFYEDWIVINKQCIICNNYTYSMEFVPTQKKENLDVFVHESLNLTELYVLDLYHSLDKTEISIKDPMFDSIVIKHVIELDKVLDISVLSINQLIDKIHTYVVMW